MFFGKGGRANDKYNASSSLWGYLIPWVILVFDANDISEKKIHLNSNEFNVVSSNVPFFFCELFIWV